MSVRKDQRSQSKMEFYINAKRLRKEVTDWLFRDFGQSRKKTINNIIPKISLEDKKIMTSMFEKYGITSKYTFTSEYPMWFIDYEKQTIIEILRDLSKNIIYANSIYATNLSELDERRNYQNKAIGNCFDLKNEIENIVQQMSIDLNKITFIDKLEKEIKLLKGWRQSDNKIRKNFEQTNYEKSETNFFTSVIKGLTYFYVWIRALKPTEKVSSSE